MPDAPETHTEAVPAAQAPVVIHLPPPADLARPAKRRSGSERRQRQSGPVLVRLLPEERAAIEEKAAAAGLSLAAYARACMLGNAGPRARKRPPVDRELLARATAAVNRVGNNWNQLTHASNRGDDVPRSELAAVGHEIIAALTDIRRAIGYDRQG